jgi:hypothetical protein
MSDSDDTRVPEVVDYGDTLEMFVDELVRIDETGVMTTLIFARRWKSANGRHRETERRVMARLLVPTHMMKRIGHLWVAGTGEDILPMPNEAPLH